MELLFVNIVNNEKITVNINQNDTLKELLIQVLGNEKSKAIAWTHFHTEDAEQAALDGYHVEGTKVFLSDDSSAIWIKQSILSEQLGIMYIDSESVDFETIRPMLVDRIKRAGYNTDLISEKTVMLGGMGILGNEIAWYLSTIGLGKLISIDYGRVDWYNLGRQHLFKKEFIGWTKVDAAGSQLKQSALGEYLPFAMKIPCFGDDRSDEELRLVINQLIDLVDKSDIVVGAFDIFSARAVLQTICIEKDKPFLSAALDIQGGDVRFFPNVVSGCYGCGFDHTLGSDAGVCTVTSLEMQRIIGALTGRVVSDYLTKNFIEPIEYRVYTSLTIEKIKRSMQGSKCQLCVKELRKNSNTSLSDFIIEWLKRY